ncbi:hypothetical protein EFR64_03835 [Lactobacillus crispatus]|nr:hypothetical protein [Lactobacillus crispatus]
MFKEINLRNHSSLHKLFYSLIFLDIIREILSISIIIYIIVIHYLLLLLTTQLHFLIHLYYIKSYNNLTQRLSGPINLISNKIISRLHISQQHRNYNRLNVIVVPCTSFVLLMN